MNMLLLVLVYSLLKSPHNEFTIDVQTISSPPFPSKPNLFPSPNMHAQLLHAALYHDTSASRVLGIYNCSNENFVMVVPKRLLVLASVKNCCYGFCCEALAPCSGHELITKFHTETSSFVDGFREKRSCYMKIVWTERAESNEPNEASRGAFLACWVAVGGEQLMDGVDYPVWFCIAFIDCRWQHSLHGLFGVFDGL